MSIKFKLTLSTIAVFLLMAIIIGFVFSSVMKSTLISEANYDAGQLCHETAYAIEKSVMSDVQIIKTLASGGIIQNGIDGMLSALQNSVRFSQYELIVMQWNDEWYRIFGDGYEIITGPTGISHDFFSEVIYGYLYDGEERGVLLIEPISSGGESVGTIIAKRPFKWLSGIITQEKEKSGASVILSVQGGEILIPNDIGHTVSVSADSPSYIVLDDGAQQTVYSGMSVDLKNIPLTVTVYVDPAVIDKKMDQYVHYYLIFAVCGLLFISGIVYAVSCLLTRSVINLAKYTEQAEISGERMPSKFTRRNDEAGILARSFALLMNKASGSLGKMRHMAYHDNLTGLKNRYSLEQDIEKLISQKKPFAFALMDIDDFKIINDMMGHAEGDRLLICIARIFDSLESDTLEAYRWGGDEFAFILSGNGIKSYKADIEKVLSEVTARFDSNSKWRISVSAGLCIFPDSATDYARMLVLSDQALILAKRSGKARYRFYEDI